MSLPTSMRQRTLVRAPRERVFDALATADGLNRWFTTTAVLEPRPGGVFTLRWSGWGVDRQDVAVDAAVIEYDRPRRFVFDWWEQGAPEERTRIETEFQEDRDGTVIDLRESGYPPTAEGIAGLVHTASGWGEALTLLKFNVEHGVRY